MNRFLFDTGTASDYINRRNYVFERAKDQVANGNRIGICVPVLAELYFGVENSASRERNLKRLKGALPTLRIWPFDVEAAEEYGRIAAELRRNGRSMQQIDIQIAATALSLGKCIVVSTDSDFVAVPGLKVENWADAK